MLTVSLLHKKDLSRSKRGEMWKATPQWLRRLLVSLLAPCWNVPVFLSILFFFGRYVHFSSYTRFNAGKILSFHQFPTDLASSCGCDDLVKKIVWRSQKLFVIQSDVPENCSWFSVTGCSYAPQRIIFSRKSVPPRSKIRNAPTYIPYHTAYSNSTKTSEYNKRASSSTWNGVKHPKGLKIQL